MATAQQAFVVHAGDRWAVKVAGFQLSVHPTQEYAISAARTWLQNNGGGELVVQNEHGQIRQKDTIYPGNDPHGNG